MSSPPATARETRTPGHGLWAVLAGLVFALVALLAGSLAQLRINPEALGAGGEITAANLLVGVFLSGWLVWWLLVIRPRQAGLLRGAVAGVLVACLSYPLVVALAEFLHADAALGDPDAVLRGFWHVLVQALFGLVTTGFASTITLGMAGALLGLVQQRLAPYPALTAAPQRGTAGLLRLLFRALVVGALSIVAFLLVAFVGLTLLPVPPLGAIPTPTPSQSYAQALAGFAVIQAREAELPLRPECRSQLLTHGVRQARVVIYLHGLTSCPEQANELAAQLFSQGNNVLVPRLPGHGEADGLTLALAHVTAEEFVGTAGDAIALAQGLGDEVVLMGLSAGGTVTTFETQNSSALSDAIAVAPFLGPAFLPPWATQAATNLLLLLPNMMIWWNADQPYSSPNMPYVYPRFATNAVAQLMRLGRIVAAEAARAPPAAAGIGVLLNRGDHTINNLLVQQLVDQWQRDHRRVDLRLLPASDGLAHDVIDPREPDARPNIVYPILFGMIAADAP